MSDVLTREAILSPRAVNVERVKIPSGGTVCVRVPSPRAFEDFEARQRKLREAGNGNVGFRARVAILCCCTEDGGPLFTGSDEGPLSDHPDALPLLDAVYAHVAPLLGWSEKAIEDRAKNSQQTPGDASTID